MKIAAVGLLFAFLALAAGCASFPDLDREFGQASRVSLDRQVAYPDHRFARKAPKGMAGITAEEVMTTYNQTYGEKPQKTDVMDLQFVPGGTSGGR